MRFQVGIRLKYYLPREDYIAVQFPVSERYPPAVRYSQNPVSGDSNTRWTSLTNLKLSAKISKDYRLKIEDYRLKITD